VASEVRVEDSAIGPVLRPAGHGDLIILYLHGDAATGRDPSPHRLERLAVLTGATVVCSRYRPTFPAALQDVEAAYECCRNAGPVAVAGERMGAGLAATLLTRLRDTGTPLPQCAVLVSALLDLTLQAKSLWLKAGADAAVNVVELRRRVADYAGGAVLTDPLLSPVYANLHGFVPVQLIVAGTDPLLDDSLAYAARAARSGVSVDLRVWPDAVHLDSGTTPAMADFILAQQRLARGNTTELLAG
jgi:acetyl esterase/lipase